VNPDPSISGATSGLSLRTSLGTGLGRAPKDPRPPLGSRDLASYRRIGVKFVTLAAVRFYQACLSPALPSACRYYPSCSAYAYEAVEKWGMWRGARLAVGRLLRCRPWGRHGYDPVP